MFLHVLPGAAAGNFTGTQTSQPSSVGQDAPVSLTSLSETVARSIPMPGNTVPVVLRSHRAFFCVPFRCIPFRHAVQHSEDLAPGIVDAGLGDGREQLDSSDSL